MKFKKLVLALFCTFGIVVISVMWSTPTEIVYIKSFTPKEHTEKHSKDLNLKYVLLWTNRHVNPFVYLKEGQETFIKKKCKTTNCYITSSKEYFETTSAFDVILFRGADLFRKPNNYRLPPERSTHQSYIYTSRESSHYYPVLYKRYKRFFNFTWTYKLNSDIKFCYFIIRDHNGTVIGPNPQAAMSWRSIDDMLPINDSIKAKLSKKKTAAAWFVSNCKTYSKRERLAKMIIEELKKHNLTVDIYGKCGNKICSRKYKEKCFKMLQRDYYFYFAFENSWSEDYVTEKLFNALQNYVVPVVFGGADYKRFMPDGIYLNAAQLSIEELVNQIVEIIKDRKKYYNLFKWHNHYSYHLPKESIDTDPYCEFCNFINNIKSNASSTIMNFKKWWNPRYKYKFAWELFL